MPYPPNPNQPQWGAPTPGFNAPGGYPPQPPPHVGFHMPPPTQPGYGYPGSDPAGYDPNKPSNPPYMDPNDPNYVAGMGFDDKSIRAGFIRRVYSILSVS